MAKKHKAAAGCGVFAVLNIISYISAGKTILDIVEITKSLT